MRIMLSGLLERMTPMAPLFGFIVSAVLQLALPSLFTIGAVLLSRVSSRWFNRAMVVGSVLAIVAVLPSLAIHPFLPLHQSLSCQQQAMAALSVQLIRQSGYAVFAVGFIAMARNHRKLTEKQPVDGTA